MILIKNVLEFLKKISFILLKLVERTVSQSSYCKFTINIQVTI